MKAPDRYGASCEEAFAPYAARRPWAVRLLIRSIMSVS